MKKLIFATLGVLLLSGSMVYASIPEDRAVNNNIKFDMSIGILNSNSRTKPEDRQTTARMVNGVLVWDK
ncbi:MAG: hypothetical protein LBD38_02740 [Streptococcaceae bacterium]|jgi:hypothetical protein|nr:hypothetical protein [Streptococcaceae bacterium]